MNTLKFEKFMEISIFGWRPFLPEAEKFIKRNSKLWEEKINSFLAGVQFRSFCVPSRDAKDASESKVLTGRFNFWPSPRKFTSRIKMQKGVFQDHWEITRQKRK